ncbi:hypothetical protein JKF63_05658 [Porcisia hertigi]|uniref:Uncharacterized protein n=1 Tax=Porcisia hertigi TaxID=2761500 RepID=A0A836IUE2_9TRYP|nr:hypothetical protein JKF63_05658 [Porcisia hertigi]
MPLRIGSFNVCCYHNCANAAAIHTELKRHHVDAAVVDHAFLISPLHLAVALFRVEASADLAVSRGPCAFSSLFAEAPSSPPTLSETLSSLPHPTRQISDSRQIFAALSLSHNLDRILQVLPPGPQTTSVVIIYRHSGCVRAAASSEGAVEANNAAASTQQDGKALDALIHACVQRTNSAAQTHMFAHITELFWTGAAFAFADISKVSLFYGISESMLLAAQRSLTRSDVRRVCTGVESQAAQAQVLRWHALEICVTTLLSACTA